jgi:hypothetical protein
MFNDNVDPTFEIYYHYPDRGNVEVGECEACITRNIYASDSFYPETNWDNHINAEITTTSHGVVFQALRMRIDQPADEIYGYASLMLGWMDNPALYEVNEELGLVGVSHPPSGIDISPVFWIVPTNPINDPPNLRFDALASNYNPNYIPQTYGVYTLKQPTGAYLREFGACYNNGNGIGPCAAVVNPTSSTVFMPQTVQTYKHQVSISGYGVITQTQFNGGDTGTVSVTAAPPGATLAANTAVILTQ